jgi:hypothetical protein
MYYVGWVGCPHCDFRSGVCIEVEGPLPQERCIFVCCPNDGSEHRFSLARMQLLADCPSGLQPAKLEEFDQVGRPSALRTGAFSSPRPWMGLVLAGLGALGATALLFAWMALR